ncbi:hypothetical protein BZG02_15585 [Labilibaculum filiforme]|uniref:Dehalogenase n=1 Tax=Labilibaculum filiforme TaxID=1940526 RepID=A0A2N3HU65_9BACT|nr:hypothetical protein [Labilibaculum filiforme]PKQ61606.1 hypothetical protein BZG02_15585 [Labilibaculum filiforme]
MVFTGTETLFFLLGIITTLFILGLIKYNKQLKFNALSWALLGTGSFLCIFCIAWSVSAVLEGVPRAASMGMVVFGIPSLLMLLLGRRFAIKKSK